VEVVGGIPSSDAASLAGICVLVVEDEYFVAVDCADVLRSHGARVLGPVPDAARARELLATDTAHCALLDVNLKGQLAFELAAELIGLGIPTIFTTGYDASVLPPALRDAPRLQKPVEVHALVNMVRREASAPRRNPTSWKAN
jgi:DNA-binding response OmpR family regulator